MDNLTRAAPQIMRELADHGWQLAYDATRTADGFWRRDLLATSPDTGLSLRSVRELAEAQVYVLVGSRDGTRSTRRWRLSAEAARPGALDAAIRAARPSIHLRASLGRMLRSSGWQVDGWRANGQGAITYTSPPHCLPVTATFITESEDAAPGWKIRLPYGGAASASPDVPAPVMTAFLLATAAGH